MSLSNELYQFRFLEPASYSNKYPEKFEEVIKASTANKFILFITLIYQKQI